MALLAACEPAGSAAWTRLDAARMGDVLLTLPDEMIYEIASAADGTVFVSTFGSDVYRRLPGDTAWTRIIDLAPAAEGQGPMLSIHPYSRGSFIALDGWRIYRWREGQALRQEKTEVSAASARCGDFTARLLLWAAWGREDDTYVVGDHGTVLHYRNGAWRMEPNPLRAESPSMCYESLPTDLMAVGGADGWVYAAGRQVMRSRGDGVWEKVTPPGAGDSLSIGAIASERGGMLFAAAPLGDARIPQPLRFYRRGRREGEWRGVALMPPAASPGMHKASAHPGGPSVFFSWEGRVAVVRGGAVRSYYAPPGRVRLRGAVPAGRDVLVAANDSVTGMVVRLPR